MRPAEPLPPPEPPGPSSEQLAAAAARQLIGSAVAAGRWRAEDADAFRALLGQMDDERRPEAMRDLTLAGNAQKLQLEGPPL